ncbi:MAG: bifunctional [glutamate--ammonia ligase]-adenylyl-L-tyrosine phosphorylase/[glutamate--ammonia-ligase] adenylyltransferase [Deltaproteobacteria bacterium]|nr:bifunctional [glutamate--ammonia ligase]-adenylyl-L-tyrosine phosphorylase/[glutamate--ammonia-ligase] adenylyltransferase [Deltaproteobacteria bacterium]
MWSRLLEDVAARTIDPDRAREALRRFAEAGGARDRAIAELVAEAAVLAPYAATLAIQDPAIAPAVLRAGTLDRALSSPSSYESELPLAPDSPELRSSIRRLRHREMFRLAVREASGRAPPDVVMQELSALAAALCDAAVRAGRLTLDERMGEARTSSGDVCRFVVLGMGKLGGEELNYGSDIDLLYLYETDDGEAGEHSLHEYFVKLSSVVTAMIGEVTDHGFAFRVDLRLRPEGSRGPICNALAAAERYYETWGRTWERAALVKARPVGGSLDLGEEALRELRPFVYRRAVEPKVVHEIDEVRRRARREAGFDDERDLKLGHGGIRQIELFVQALQLVWGGITPSIRERGTLDALDRLLGTGLVTEHEHAVLGGAYQLLRRVEHAVQMLAFQQTQRFPDDQDERAQIARRLGYGGPDALGSAIERARRSVDEVYAALIRNGHRESPEREALLDAIAAGAGRPELEGPAAALGFADAQTAANHLARLGRRPDDPLGPLTRERLPGLGDRLLFEVLETPDPDQALRHLDSFFSRMGGGHAGTMKLLADEPALARLLVGLFGTSDFLSSALVGHPELAGSIVLGMRAGPPTPSEVSAQVAEVAEPLLDDTESLMAALQRAKREITLRIGLGDIAGQLDLEAVSWLLSTLADSVLEQALRHASRATSARLGSLPLESMAIFALGKLGGRELGYAGDLDVVFLYDAGPDHGGAAEAYTRVAQRVITLLTAHTAEGTGYYLDTRLRPSGSQGMLVSSLEGFERYHRESAASFERQVLIKARFVAGNPEVGERAARIIESAAYSAVGPDTAEMARLRRRMETELAAERGGRYNLKVGRGGLADVEFVTQLLQLRHGARDRGLRVHGTLEAIDLLRRGGHLDDSTAATLGDGYRFLRRLENRLRIVRDEPRTELPRDPAALTRLARRLGYRERSDADAAAERLVRDYRKVTSSLREVFGRFFEDSAP